MFNNRNKKGTLRDSLGVMSAGVNLEAYLYTPLDEIVYDICLVAYNVSMYYFKKKYRNYIKRLTPVLLIFGKFCIESDILLNSFFGLR